VIQRAPVTFRRKAQQSRRKEAGADPIYRVAGGFQLSASAIGDVAASSVRLLDQEFSRASWTEHTARPELSEKGSNLGGAERGADADAHW